MWDKFTSRLQQGIDKHIPTRSSGTKDGFPWINQEIHRLMRKRDKLYRRWSRSGRPDDQKKFLKQKHLVRRIIDRAYEKYLKDILGLNDEEHDLESPPKVKTKKLYSLLKTFKTSSQRNCSTEGQCQNLYSRHRQSKRPKCPIPLCFQPKKPDKPQATCTEDPLPLPSQHY